MKPLEGIRIVDFTHTLAGPFATMLLADLGAEVVKIESPSGDETRQWAPFVNGVSAYYLSINRGKKSVVLDLTKEEDRETAYKLVKESHVVFENFRPGVREKLGVDPNKLFEINRDLVYVSIKGFKPGSKYEDLPAYDIIIQGLSGIMVSTGYENEPPVRIPFALFDVYTGMMATIYALTGLLSDKPYYAEVYLFDTAIFSMCYLPIMYLLTGVKPRRMGHQHPSIVPYQAFQDKDGKWFIVAAANDRFFSKLCEAINRSELLLDPRFNTNPSRVANRDTLIKILQDVFRERSRDDWIRILRGKGVPVAPVYELNEVLEDEYVVKELIIELKHPSIDKIKQITQPGTINGERPVSTTHPPLLGEHNSEILNLKR